MEVVQKELFCLTKNKKWKLVHEEGKSFPTKYSSIYSYILFLLNQSQGKGSSVSTNFRQGSHTDMNSSISIRVLNIESHRHCTILECYQIDHLTRGSRYLLYGIKRPGHEDYGIGKDLEMVAESHITPNTLPKDIAYYLDD